MRKTFFKFHFLFPFFCVKVICQVVCQNICYIKLVYKKRRITGRGKMSFFIGNTFYEQKKAGKGGKGSLCAVRAGEMYNRPRGD
ncbi:hypothetical protein COD13_25605 [Priestia megaterium]|nr:hypothetical protein COK03_03760 [Priestia megaterium]PGT51010.1 hypothetical protein COD13_25605 [Priestia megaterium]